jgi:hypothetical protein
MVITERGEGVESARMVVTDLGELPCSGCLSESMQDCDFVQCNQRHGTSCCAFCPEFPCQLITDFRNDECEHHKAVLNNLERILEAGIDKWLEEQEQYWKCPACGTRTIWYQEKCHACGGRIINNT